MDVKWRRAGWICRCLRNDHRPTRGKYLRTGGVVHVDRERAKMELERPSRGCYSVRVMSAFLFSNCSSLQMARVARLIGSDCELCVGERFEPFGF